MVPRRRIARKLLVASLGVAAVSYAVGCEKQPVGNLARPAADATAQPSGTLTPPPPIDTGSPPPVVGNLMPPPPPPPDAGDAGKPKK
jgi:hypothetical protein